MTFRGFVVLALVISLTIATPMVSGTAAAVAATAPSVTSTQAFTGGGSGSFDSANGRRSSGSYVSTGQLGDGHLAIHNTDSHFFRSVGTGPIEFDRSDGMSLTGTTKPSPSCPPGLTNTTCVTADLTGTTDIERAHIDLVVQDTFYRDDLVAVAFLMRGTLTLQRRMGYAMVDSNGTTYTFGGIDHLGDAPTVNAVDLELTHSGRGYWIVNNTGQVYTFGDAPYLGGADIDPFLSGERVTSMSATPTGKGYWLFTSDGRTFRFGDAKLFGDLASTTLNAPIVGSIATPTGSGYYMVAGDGGVFAFGDAKFRGSMGATRLNQPVVGIVPTADNTGYWLVAADGGVFSFNAPFHGSMGAVALNRPIVTMVPYGHAYLMIASDGGAFNFSNVPFFGSEGAAHLPTPIVNGASTP
jgi:hypothetical protein